MSSQRATTAHYDRAYFSWQASSTGVFGGKANRFRFQPHIQATDRVVDFGCGGGYLLANLICSERLGIEVNPVARVEAERNGVPTVESPHDVPDGWADVLISNSALEHVEHPLGVLRGLLPKLRVGGTAVFVVPHETLASTWQAGDINQHLYTWSPLNLGNLFTCAGYQVESVLATRLMWPPHFQLLGRIVGTNATFRALCTVYRALRMALWPLRPIDSHSSVVCVARRPEHAIPAATRRSLQ